MLPKTFDICFYFRYILTRVFGALGTPVAFEMRKDLQKGDHLAMISAKNFGRTLLSSLMSAFLTVLSVLTVGTKPHELPVTPEDFKPVLRFAVCSDVHFENDNELEAKGEEAGEEYEEYLQKVDVPGQRLAAAIQTAYSYAESYDGYKGLDAFAVAGDFTDKGAPEQYEAFNKTCKENLRAGTQRIVCSGNHEYYMYRSKDRAEGARVFEKYIGSLNNHYVINGYHFISVSYDDKVETYLKSGVWLKKELDKAVADTGDKPIFVFQHPAPFFTVYGSVKWGDPTISAILSSYPQVVDFSGHSHYPINDPRSIWQGTFTALGCGTLAYFETELDTIAGNFPGDVEQAAQFYFVEADKDGNLRIKAYDLLTNQFLVEYYLTGLAEKNYPYSYQNLSRLDSAPVFKAREGMSASLNENGETVLSFDGAKDRFVAESYKLTVSQGLKKVFEDNFSGKYMYLFEDDRYEINLGKLESGKKYTVTLYALNAFAKPSRLQRYSFTAE